MAEIDAFNGHSDRPAEFDLMGCGSANGNNSLLSASCVRLRTALVAYSQILDEAFELMGYPDDLIGSDPASCERARITLVVEIENVAACPARSLADLSMKQAALETCMEFCCDHHGLIRSVAISLLRDIARVYHEQPSVLPIWKFRPIRIPTSWSLRPKSRLPIFGTKP
jgi:hypothetical protein